MVASIPSAPTRVLVLMREPPGADMRPRERLDVILMALAFELEVSAAFLGAGVLQLMPRDAGGDGVHDYGAALGSLPLHGIHRIYVDAEALRRYGLEAGRLRVEVSALEAPALAELLHRADLLL